MRCCLLLLPAIYHLPPCVPSADSPIPLPGCTFLSSRARRWGAPGSLDTDCRAVPADRCARQTAVPPVRPGPESRPREAKDALCQQSLGPDGSRGRGRLGSRGWRRRWGAAVLGVLSITVQAPDLLHTEDRGGKRQQERRDCGKWRGRGCWSRRRKVSAEPSESYKEECELHLISPNSDIRIGHQVAFLRMEKKRLAPVDTQSIISPTFQPAEVPPPSKPPRKRHPSFDLQALLAPRRGTSTPKPAESPVGGPSRNSPMSWLGRRAVADPVITTSMATAISSWGGSGGGGGGGVLIRGVEVSSKEVVDHTGSPRQHVLLGRTEREMGADRAGSTTQRFSLFIPL